MIIVDLALATICFANTCANVLVGNHTPTGTFSLYHMQTEQAGYGGDVIVFHETDTYRLAIHRVWMLNPKERRMEKIRSSNPKVRRYVSNGCINVEPEVYQQILDCCINQQLVIK